MKVRAYAKVNWSLEIVGRRADGYHRLVTLFQTISLADTLTLTLTPGPITCRVSDPKLPTDGRNLAVRAAVMLREAIRESRGVHLELEKRIPLGAGLGGGSSDAAAVLRALPRLWRCRVAEQTLHRLSQRLGADVPFFLKGGCCLAGGVGECLTPLPPHPTWWLVLVKPAFGLATQTVYGWLDERQRLQSPRAIALAPLTPHRAMTTMRAAVSQGLPPSRWGGQLFNRLEEAVFPRYPEIARIKAVFKSLGAVGALMSGSGSAVYGVVASQAQGKKILRELPRDLAHAWLLHTVN